eukprot:COSAG01_NODE_7136_length_3338_cov_7.143078_6_plen_54_part_00
MQVRLQTFEFKLKYEEKAKELREGIAAVRVVRPPPQQGRRPAQLTPSQLTPRY